LKSVLPAAVLPAHATITAATGLLHPARALPAVLTAVPLLAVAAMLPEVAVLPAALPPYGPSTPPSLPPPALHPARALPAMLLLAAAAKGGWALRMVCVGVRWWWWWWWWCVRVCVCWG